MAVSVVRAGCTTGCTAAACAASSLRSSSAAGCPPAGAPTGPPPPPPPRPPPPRPAPELVHAEQPLHSRGGAQQRGHSRRARGRGGGRVVLCAWFFSFCRSRDPVPVCVCNANGIGNTRRDVRENMVRKCGCKKIPSRALTRQISVAGRASRLPLNVNTGVLYR